MRERQIFCCITWENRGWASHVVRKGTRKREGKRPLGRLWCNWEVLNRDQQRVLLCGVWKTANKLWGLGLKY